MTILKPSIEYTLLSPMLIMFGAAVVGLLIEAVLPGESRRYRAQVTVSTAALGSAFIAVLLLRNHHGTAVMGSVMIDGPTLFFQGAILLAGMFTMAPIAERRLGAFALQGSLVPDSRDEQHAAAAGILQTEIFPLFLLTIGGMLAFCASADLLTMFVALEVLSLPLYVLCGLAKRRRTMSQEAALKYFLLGAFSSALFLYGVAFLYGSSGALTLSGVAESLCRQGVPLSLAMTGIGLLAAGLLFKVGAVPFHWWVPDVYQGAPTPVTGFMSAATKIAAFGAMLRLFYVALPNLRTEWRPVLWGLAVLTMLAAAVLTVTQTDIKRLLAYSSVTNVGFLLLGVSGSHDGLSATMFYLATYGATALGAFAVISTIRQSDGQEATDTCHWSGLGKYSPKAAGALTLFLLSMAGIPLTAGFVGKFAVFESVASAGGGPLVVIGVIASAIAAFAYARVIVMMFFSEHDFQTPRAVFPEWPTTAVIALAATVTVGLGVMPEPLLDLADRVGSFLA
ncbi:NADH-quinone oxidoreductase subunit NuoN [Mycolicibacterium brisbanense]|uniref:NADH-quinone oxidoreductase subunit N n=1 Tax=Mycolicibacterium brisbanense TaxID=146020 RepID=A0A100W2X2_9MYCO|nr:NADH-quinone oxidoreductase subunit NuoN [Mycolicibacterium brisbanense]MCV7156524.1 NADH-quinone oxidoreductase subunit NuoN [Mycolicibacterium brisbanense]GAS90657.1 NADH-quinone oxidoreductase subunit N [Mycolicibacterium brisbanense]